jgi:hypothetical protein
MRVRRLQIQLNFGQARFRILEIYCELCVAALDYNIFFSDLVKLDCAALLVASEARRARQFVDTGNFSLRCLVCQAGLKGQTDAQQHAKSTGHTNFAEY